jgi:hypothetical protein
VNSISERSAETKGRKRKEEWGLANKAM